MSDLMKAGCYQLRHNRGFWAMTLISLTLSSVLLLDAHGEDILHTSLYNTPLLSFLILVFTALFVGEDFEKRTLHTLVSAGHSRLKVLICKAAVCLAADTMILAGPLLLHGLISAFMPAGAAAVDAGQAVAVLAAIWAMGALPLMAAFAFCDVGRTMAVSLLFYFLMIFTLNADQSGQAARILPMGQLRLISLGQKPGSAALTAIDGVWTALLLAGAYGCFFHRDLS